VREGARHIIITLASSFQIPMTHFFVFHSVAVPEEKTRASLFCALDRVLGIEG